MGTQNKKRFRDGEAPPKTSKSTSAKISDLVERAPDHVGRRAARPVVDASAAGARQTKTNLDAAVSKSEDWNFMEEASDALLDAEHPRLETSTSWNSSLPAALLLSKVIAPDYSGVRCVAVHPDESEIVVARENGSMIRLELRYFQNVPHFVEARHTGGCRRRTFTSLHYVHPAGQQVPRHNHSASVYLIATLLSGQIVVYQSNDLFPVYVHQRTGGAIWSSCLLQPDFTTASSAAAHFSAPRLLTAVADGSWHQLRVVFAAPTRHTSAPGVRLELERLIPRVPGADRALSVHASVSAQLAAGTDDAGNVLCWRLGLNDTEGSRSASSAGAAADTLTCHDTLWTTTLPKGIGLCCCVCTGGGVGRAVVAAGTTAGEVILLDAKEGHLCSVFAQHRGPISSIVASADQLALFATGWHEQLRCYRCDIGSVAATSFAGVVQTTTTNEEGSLTKAKDGTADVAEWFPAEVKRRTHYHEATQLAVLAQRQLLLSASRDGTVMYAPLHRVFIAPANYLPLTTQQFAFAQEKSILLHTRYGRIEAFEPDSGCRHWRPVFAYASHGAYHLSGLWCNPDLTCVVFSTDERFVILALQWRGEGVHHRDHRQPKNRPQRATSSVSTRLSQSLAGAGERQVRRIEERANVGAGRGIVDVVLLSSSSFRTNPKEKEDTESGPPEDEAAAAEMPSSCVYLLQDNGVLFTTSSAGAPQVFTAFTSVLHPEESTTESSAPLPRVSKLHWVPSGSTLAARGYLIASGPEGAFVLPLLPDGSIDEKSSRYRPKKIFRLPRAIPLLQSSSPPATPHHLGTPFCFVGLSPATQRYVCGPGLWDTDGVPLQPSTAQGEALAWPFPKSVISLPSTLPHDVVFVAAFETTSPDYASLLAVFQSAENTALASSAEAPRLLLLGYFSRGLLLTTEQQWRMIHRGNVEAAFVLGGSTGALETGAETPSEGGSCASSTRCRVLVLERNLEKTLESMPLCWKVRRFGN